MTKGLAVRSSPFYEYCEHLDHLCPKRISFLCFGMA